MAETATGDNPLAGYAQSASFFRIPRVHPLHDPACLAEVTLAGAEVLARDAQTGEPVLVRRRLGQGEAYLLCTWAYPGNSWLKPLVDDFLHALAETVPAQVALEDGTGDVLLRGTAGVGTVRHGDGPPVFIFGSGPIRSTRFTGSTLSGPPPEHRLDGGRNEMACRLRLGENRVDIKIGEGRLSEVVWAGPLAFLVEDPKVHVSGLARTAGGYTVAVHGYGRAEIAVQALGEHRLGAVTWRGLPVSLEPEAGWTRARFDFADRSTGELAVGVLES